MNEYKISDEAIRDLDDISDYFFDNNLEAGEQFFRAFSKKCRQLAQFPKIGRSYAHIRSDLRGIALRGFIILYRVTDLDSTIRVEILRIVHGKRDLAKIFAENDQ